MSWFYLFIAGFFEICWAVGMKYSYGFTKLIPTIFTLATMSASVFFLAFAVKNLPMGTAYAVWTGIGTIGTAIAGIILFGESTSILRIICLLLIISGIIGLKLLVK